MFTSFIDLAKTGQNKLWMYVVTIGLCLGTTTLVGYTIELVFTGLRQSPLSTSILDYLYFLALLSSFGVFLGVLLLCVKFIHRRPIISVLNNVGQLRWDKLWRSSLLWVLMLGVAEIGWFLYNPSSYIFTGNFWTLVWTGTALILFPIQAAAEEIFYRGYLLQGAQHALEYRWLAIFFSCLFFSLAHINNPEIGAYGVVPSLLLYSLMAFLFCLVSVWDNGLEYAIGIHAVNNIYLAVIVNYPNSALRTPALFTHLEYNIWFNFGITLIGGSAFLYYIYHRIRVSQASD